MAGQAVYTQGPKVDEALRNGNRTVTTAGTRVQLSTTSVPTYEVFIQARPGNSGVIYVGGSSVASTNGIILAASVGVTLSATNLNQVWLDSSVSGESVNYTYWSV